MFTMRSIVLSSATSLIILSNAFAADLAPQAVEPAVPVVPHFSWTGVYAGIQAGYAWGSSSYDVPQTGGDAPIDPKGGFGGIYTGYNYQLPSNFVVGGEADINGGDISASNVHAPRNPATIFGAKSDWFGSARLRAGYSFDHFLPFITGGVAIANYKHDAQGALAPDTSWSDTYVGWTVGAGLEYAVTDNLIVRAEYRYADYGSKSYPVTRAGNGREFIAHDIDLKTNDVRIGLGYKF
jgi:outer membrane immunogenic protein